MKLWEYKGKRLKVTDIHGNVFVGTYDHYTSGLDAPSGVACLSIEPDYNPDRILIEFEEPEIVSIEVIVANAPAMAEAV